MQWNSGWQDMGLCVTLTYSEKSLDAICTRESIAKLRCELKQTNCSVVEVLRKHCILGSNRSRNWTNQNPSSGHTFCQKWRASSLIWVCSSMTSTGKVKPTGQTSVVCPTDQLRFAVLVCQPFLDAVSQTPFRRSFLRCQISSSSSKLVSSIHTQCYLTKISRDPPHSWRSCRISWL
jgi:hypothetical protein